MTARTIIHLIETDGPGGAETIVSQLVRRADRRRFVPLAAFPPRQGWLQANIPSSVVRSTVPSAGTNGALPDIRYLLALRRVFKAESPAVVHAHSFDTAFYAALALLGLPAKLVATFHGASDAQRVGLRNRLKWLALRRTDAIVCVSAALARLARNASALPSHRVQVIWNGIDLAAFAPARHGRIRSRLSLADRTVLVGAVGNVRAPKGYDLLLRAIAQIRSIGLDVHLAIAGDDAGPLGDALRRLRTTLELDGVVSFVGFVDDVPEFLNGLDIFVLSSLSEGFSLSTVQALASSLPVVATKSGGPEEIVEDEISGLLVDTGSESAIAHGIVTLLRDRELGRRLAAAARARATSLFSIETMVERYEALYERVIAT